MHPEGLTPPLPDQTISIDQPTDLERVEGERDELVEAYDKVCAELIDVEDRVRAQPVWTPPPSSNPTGNLTLSAYKGEIPYTEVWELSGEVNGHTVTASQVVSEYLLVHTQGGKRFAFDSLRAEWLRVASKYAFKELEEGLGLDVV